MATMAAAMAAAAILALAIPGTMHLLEMLARPQTAKAVGVVVLRDVSQRKRAEKAELELADLVDRDDFDAGAVRKAFSGFQDARRNLESERFEMLLAVRESLTAAQWRELLEIRRFLDRQRETRRPGEARSTGSCPVRRR